jgi:hypothetical protein
MSDRSRGTYFAAWSAGDSNEHQRLPARRTKEPRRDAV